MWHTEGNEKNEVWGGAGVVETFHKFVIKTGYFSLILLILYILHCDNIMLYYLLLVFDDD